MNNEWFTSSQLADLPGLPKSDRNIRIKAKKEGWVSRPRKRGKGNEFHINSLPNETKAYLTKKRIEALSVTDKAAHDGRIEAKAITRKEVVDTADKQQAKAESLMVFQTLSPEQQTRANARLLILKSRETYLAPYKDINKLTLGEKLFDEAYNAQQFDFELWVYQQVEKVSWQSCRRWLKQLDEKGLARLAGNYHHNRRASLIEQQPDLQNYLFAVITGKPYLAARPYVLERMINEKLAQYPHWQIPSPSSISRWITRWKADNGAAFAYMTNPDDYNNKHRPLFGKMYPWVQAPNDCWEFDSTPTDVQLRVNGKLVRHSIIAVIDVYTRRVKLLLSPTSNSEGICLLLRNCLMEWGMLNDGGVARTDNGSDYVSKRVTAIFDMLNIEQSRANAFSGWEKPFIERFFRTLSQGLFELLPGYIGHSVTERQQIKAVKTFAKRIGEGKKKAEQEAIELALEPAELEEIMNDWLEHRYHQLKHSKLKGNSPYQQYVESGYRPRKVKEVHSLDYLLNFAGEATVIRGGVSTGGIRYTAPELMNPE
ncbi:DNA-binding protein [Photobacterium nomapromontoriensis]|uniref:DNA-binding protein n=1 Tax=Photobacterium nomapromontoriensis TaxID=2910237 RepID=UPI003D0D8A41